MRPLAHGSAGHTAAPGAGTELPDSQPRLCPSANTPLPPTALLAQATAGSASSDPSFHPIQSGLPSPSQTPCGLSPYNAPPTPSRFIVAIVSSRRPFPSGPQILTLLSSPFLPSLSFPSLSLSLSVSLLCVCMCLSLSPCLSPSVSLSLSDPVTSQIRHNNLLALF